MSIRTAPATAPFTNRTSVNWPSGRLTERPVIRPKPGEDQTLKISGIPVDVGVDVDRDTMVQVALLLKFKKTRELLRFECSRCGWHVHLFWRNRPTFKHDPNNPKECPGVE